MTAPSLMIDAAATLASTRRRGRIRIAVLLGVVGVALLAYAVLWPRYRITYSLTESLPWRLYLVHIGQRPLRGDLAAFYPPDNRFYPHHSGFMKYVAGVAGDQVTREGQAFYINDRAVGIAKTTSRYGLPLDPGPVGVIPDGFYFVWTPEVDSYDSRYADIGWIPLSRVVGVAEPLF